MDYQEKLRLAKKALDSGSYDKETIEYIFPELKKSKDEGERENVEPKFRVGNWIVFNDNLYNIGNIALHKYYECLRVDGTVHTFSLNIDSKSHLWTIQDAKDGDVIAFDNSTIVIFKDLYNATTFHSYCHIEDDIFNISKDDMPDWWEGEGFHPATKEQHDLLFQRMEEAGYEWDAIKKELKKIEQKPSTSVTEFDAEIERFCKECFITDANERDWVFCIARHFADWQKNRKNPAWSEEDKNMLQNILECLKNGWSKLPTDILKYESWLKSLKERYNWKPSDEQMQALEKVRVILHNPSIWDESNPILYQYEELMRDLIKLREE